MSSRDGNHVRGAGHGGVKVRLEGRHPRHQMVVVVARRGLDSLRVVLSLCKLQLDGGRIDGQSGCPGLFRIGHLLVTINLGSPCGWRLCAGNGMQSQSLPIVVRVLF